MDLNIDYIAAKYNGAINIGYVDCSKERVLCKNLEIQSFPTIKYVMNNVIHDYYGRKSLRSLIEMCDALNRSGNREESITTVSTDEEMSALLQSSTVLFFCVYDDSQEGQRLFNEFQNVSQHLLLYTKFGATKSMLTALPPIRAPYIMRLEGEEDLQYFRLNDMEETLLLTWIRQRTLPLLPEFRGCAFNDIVRSGKPTLLLALSPEYFVEKGRLDSLKHLLRSLPVSVNMKKYFAFAYLDGTEWVGYMKDFGVDVENLPCALVMSERV
ncbi:protein disulfide isomerase [Blastocystis sp. subtype 4]|uniref:protein disulfide isomerase n=1 Tax=Blastocystis sp. subtype 4 TaxID=944170 RepID=UPI0007122B23|nr:protein disulfide isomerase [Blastocystis sp. subtype 4]KNB41973.1 protein disulfide isomerase [Blastocystis sp. subtype 4]|eukprot:XP_014525416.1 protein disulfide isomerase [Blastocystis sp. subtype 4]